jgi:hypothetical protein
VPKKLILNGILGKGERRRGIGERKLQMEMRKGKRLNPIEQIKVNGDLKWSWKKLD